MAVPPVAASSAVLLSLPLSLLSVEEAVAPSLTKVAAQPMLKRSSRVMTPSFRVPELSTPSMVMVMFSPSSVHFREPLSPASLTLPFPLAFSSR